MTFSENIYLFIYLLFIHKSFEMAKQNIYNIGQRPCRFTEYSLKVYFL